MAELRPPLSSFLQKEQLSPIQPEDLEPEVSSDKVIEKLRGRKGDKGDPGKDGEAPAIDVLEALILPLIPDPVAGKDGRDGKPGPQGEPGESVLGERGPAGKDGQDGKDGTEITPKEVVEKINVSRGTKIKRSRVEGLDEVESIARTAQRQVQSFTSLGGNRQTKLQLNGAQVATGADTLNFIGGTLVPVGDGSTVSYTPPSSGGGGFTLLPATGTVNGLNQTFTFTQKPTYIVADGAWYQALDNNGATNWSGTTTITMTIPPQSAIWGFV